jgi:hypothetical protein
MAKNGNTIGYWAFIIGVVITVITGLLGSLSSRWMVILVLIGLVIGFLNVTGTESSSFLMASVSLVIVSAFGKNVLSAVPMLGNVLDAIMVLVVPATVIVALKSVHGLAKN